MTSVADTLNGGRETEDRPLWVAIPPGYFQLPLNDVEGSIARAESVLTEVADAEQRPRISVVTGVLAVFLADLASAGALYCGIGRHTSPVDDSVVTSSLVVSLQQYEGTRDPRLLLKDLVQAKADAGEHGQADLVDVRERPVFFFERTRHLATPQLPDGPEVARGSSSPVYQLEAFVPADDGAKLAAIEFSTPFTSCGPEFRGMIVQMAASVSFDPPPSGPSGTIRKVLG